MEDPFNTALSHYKSCSCSTALSHLKSCPGFVAVLGREEGYTVKFTPPPEGVPEGPPQTYCPGWRPSELPDSAGRWIRPCHRSNYQQSPPFLNFINQMTSGLVMVIQFQVRAQLNIIFLPQAASSRIGLVNYVSACGNQKLETCVKCLTAKINPMKVRILLTIFCKVTLSQFKPFLTSLRPYYQNSFFLNIVFVFYSNLQDV